MKEKVVANKKIAASKENMKKSGWNGGNHVAAEQIKMHWDKSNFN